MERCSAQHTDGISQGNLFDAGILKPRIDYSRPLERVCGDEYIRLKGKRAAIYARIVSLNPEGEVQWQVQECQDCAMRYGVIIDETLVFVDRGLQPSDQPAATTTASALRTSGRCFLDPDMGGHIIGGLERGATGHSVSASGQRFAPLDMSPGGITRHSASLRGSHARFANV